MKGIVQKQVKFFLCDRITEKCFKKEEKITCLYQTIYPEKSESRRGRKEKNHLVVIRQKFSIFEKF